MANDRFRRNNSHRLLEGPILGIGRRRRLQYLLLHHRRHMRINYSSSTELHNNMRHNQDGHNRNRQCLHLLRRLVRPNMGNKGHYRRNMLLTVSCKRITTLYNTLPSNNNNNNHSTMVILNLQTCSISRHLVGRPVSPLRYLEHRPVPERSFPLDCLVSLRTAVRQCLPILLVAAVDPCLHRPPIHKVRQHGRGPRLTLRKYRGPSSSRHHKTVECLLFIPKRPLHKANEFKCRHWPILDTLFKTTAMHHQTLCVRQHTPFHKHEEHGTRQENYHWRFYVLLWHDTVKNFVPDRVSCPTAASKIGRTINASHW